MDPTSFANFSEARVKDFHLSLDTDFEKKIFTGHVDLNVEIVKDGTATVVLDTRDLTISNVSLVATPDQKLEFKIGDVHPAFGSALTIVLPEQGRSKGHVFGIRIHYQTSPQSSAIQWLSESQTAGKKHPYLFTQCQAIHARALLPCQDTPANKIPYTADITVPSPLVALMSALSTGQKSGNKQNITYEFKQPIPIPSYLVAIAVGALEKRDIGPRSAVWSEKEMVDAGAFEFAETEKFIAAAEEVCGPYAWGRYDILLLPPSFPYGGMENPCLTFVTPTLLAGDRSLATVVAHEIAHSWMGNLVTNRTWEHFWMNEGFCVFLERKIIRSVYGEKAMHLHALSGWKSLLGSVSHYGHDHPFTVLNVKLKDVDPDDAFSSVPYEKGFNFLYYLEGVVGGPALMDPFLRAHCEKFKFSVTDSQEWQEFFLSYFKGKVDDKKLAAIDWNAWYNNPGMPEKPNFDTSLADDAIKLANSLITNKAQPKADDMKNWSSNQIVAFLEHTQDLQAEVLKKAKEDNKLDQAKAEFATLLQAIDKEFHLTASKNSEIRFRWYTTCLRAEYEPVLPAVVEFLGSQGRMKFVRPLYRELFATNKGKQLALDTFNKYRTQYHNIASKMVSKDLGLDKA